MENQPTTTRNWTRYFWEFFMVFVAIVLGFFVENQREDYVDHQQEQQYIRSLIEDLEADTSHLSVVIHDFNRADLRLDTVISFFPKITKLSGFGFSFARKATALTCFHNKCIVSQKTDIDE